MEKLLKICLSNPQAAKKCVLSKNYRKALFSRLLMSGKLNEHLLEIDQISNNRLWLI